MRLTRAGEYAIRALRFLASRRESRWFSIQEIAEAEDIPPQFLAKVMQRLTQVALVQSACGKTGGYRLASPAEQVVLADAIQAMEGPITLNNCLMYPKECRFSDGCRMHPIWAEAQEAMLSVLRKYRLSDIIPQTPDSQPSRRRAPKSPSKRAEAATRRSA